MEFRGVFSALVTPFDDSAALSEQRIESYCRFLIGRGVDGLFPFGTTGEWPHLSVEERRRGAETVVRTARSVERPAGGRVAVVIHTGANDTASAAELSVHARTAGADAVGVISPAYYRLDDQALLDHFTAVARAVDGFPVFLYNIPGVTGNDVPPDLLLRIVRRAENVVGLKYSADDLRRFREYRQVMGADFSLFIGDDGMALPALHEGASGIVSGNSSAVPDLLVRLYRLYRQGSPSEAKVAQAELDRFIASVDESAELSTFKRILALRGIPVGEVRRPLKALPAGAQTALRRRVRGLERRGVLEPAEGELSRGKRKRRPG